MEEIKTSKFSSGISILVRIDLLWKDTHRHSRAGMFAKWNSDLDRIWLELARDLQSKEKKDEEKKDEFTLKKEIFDQFDKELEKIGSFDDHSGDSFEPLIPEQISKRNKQYKLLMEKQLFLARLENELGKGTSWDESTDEWD